MGQTFKVGEAPWEQQTAAPTSYPVGQAPWEQQKEEVVNEMPPEMQGVKGFLTRAVYKNLGGNDAASFNYLQKQFPDLEFAKDKSGEITAKSRTDGKSYRLDPKGFDWRDITDIGYDIPAGVAQGAATSAAGLAGGVLGGGLGAIPAAAATSSATGAGLEVLRQRLGEAFGIEGNADPDQVKMAAVTSAIAPLLFGTGAGAKEAGKYLATKGLAQESLKDLASAQRGVLGRTYDSIAGSVGPRLASLASGINPKVIKKAGEILPEIAEADKATEIRSEPLKAAVAQVPERLKQVTSATGKRLDELRALVDNQPGLVPAGQEVKAQGTIPKESFMQPFRDLAAKLSESGAPTEAQIKDAEALAKVISSEFEGLPDNLTAAQVDTLRKRFKERANQYGLSYGKSGQAVGSTSGAGAIDSQIAQAFEQSRRNMTDAIVQRLEAIDPKYAQEYATTSEQYSYLKKLAEENNNKFKTTKSLSNFLSRATEDDLEAQNLSDIQKITGINLEDLAIRDKAIKTFSKPSTEIQSLRGTTSTSRSVPLSLAAAGLGYYGAQQSGGDMSPWLTAILAGTLGAKAASPAAIRKYMELNQFAREIPQTLPGYKYTPYLMMNMKEGGK